MSKKLKFSSENRNFSGKPETMENWNFYHLIAEFPEKMPIETASRYEVCEKSY